MSAEPESKLSNQEQRATWLELFFDLVFVTAFQQLAQRFSDDGSLYGLAIFALMFIMVWWAWVGNTLFAGRYGNEGRVYRWGTALQLLSMGGLALGVLGDLSDVGRFFSALFCANRFVLVGMYFAQARVGTPEEGGLARTQARTFGLSAAVWLVSVWLPVGAQQLAWGLGIGLDAAASVRHRSKLAQQLPHPEHFPERVGLLVIIALGAIITEIVGGAGHGRLTITGQLPAALSLVTTLALFKLYFDEARDLPVLLAHRDGRVGTLLVWLYTHLPLMLALTALGVGIGGGLAAEGRAAEQHERLTVAISLSVFFVNLAALRVITRRALNRPRLDRSVAALLVGAGAMLALMMLPLSTLPYQSATLGVCSLTLLVFWFDPARRQLAETEQAVAEEQHEQTSAPPA